MSLVSSHGNSLPLMKGEARWGLIHSDNPPPAPPFIREGSASNPILRYCILFILCFLCVTCPSYAQDQTQDQKWQENYKKWQQLPEAKKQELRRKFAELRSMTPEERKEFENNAQNFRNLPEKQKEKLQKRLQFIESLSEEQRMAFRKVIRLFHTLPLQRKSMLRRRVIMLRAMPPERRERFLSHSPVWNRMTEEQRETMRKFLFSDEAPVLYRRRPFRLRRIL